MQKSGIFTKIKTAIINGGLDYAEIWDFYKNKNRHYKRWFRLGMCILYNHTRVYYILDAI